MVSDEITKQIEAKKNCVEDLGPNFNIYYDQVGGTSAKTKE